MPDNPTPKLRPHPFRAAGHTAPGASARPQAHLYAELDVTTNSTFLTGASHPEELITRAAELGLHSVAITDTNTLAGVVRAHTAAKDSGLRLVVGCRLVLADPLWPEVLVYPTTRRGYANLCTLLTLGKRRAEKGSCILHPADLASHHHDLLAIASAPAHALTLAHADAPPTGPTFDDLAAPLRELQAIFDDDRLSLAIWRGFDEHDAERVHALAALAARAGIPLVATNRVLSHAPERRPLQDVLTCIRLGTTVDAAGFALQANAERHLKPPDEMHRLLGEHPGALQRTILIAERAAGFSLDELRYQYPREVVPEGLTPMQHLRELTLRGAAERYASHAGGIPAKVTRAIQHELELIESLNYAPYFLTVHDLVVFARSRGILCQGRGAAANSAVCFCLGVTSVDPDRINLLFERFISRERNEPPDIDIDFEHERREEVIQYIYRKYGRDRAALTAEVITYRGRSAVRDVGKALGLSLDAVDRLAKQLDWWDSGTIDPARIAALGFNPDDRTIRLVLHLCAQIMGFPRHLSQHVGGFVITDTPLSQLVPIENAAMPDRTVIEWDKDDIDAMGMLKVDCLGLGMLTCIRKSFELISRHRGRELSLATVPAEDPAVYDMLCEADTIGVFQIESRAQMAMLPRLRPRCFYDLVIEVAIVRPGPIQGKMVHPYLRRRNGEEPIAYPNDAVREVLGRTLGVPLFQEQAMKLAIVAGGFTPGEADQLRRAMAAWKRKGNAIERFGRKLIEGMLARGYDADFAERCFEQIKGFSEYGFPESHAASFALLVYVTAWLKRHEPAAFAAALINSQPMGFYQPAQIVRDAQNHGVEARPIDINASNWDCTLEVDTGGVPVPGRDQHLGQAGDERSLRSESPDGSALRAYPTHPEIRPKAASSPAYDHALSQERSMVTPPVPPLALRLGMRLVSGLRQRDIDALVSERDRAGPYTSIESLWRRVGTPVATLRALARADAFASLGLDRRHALWAIQGMKDESLPLFDSAESSTDGVTGISGTRVQTVGAHEHVPVPVADTDQAHLPLVSTMPVPLVQLPPASPSIRTRDDYEATGLSLKAHPMSFVRADLNARGVIRAADLRDEAACPHGRPVQVAGMVLIRQRPATASGIVFITIEDETGIANLIVRPRVYERCRAAARHSGFILVRGKVERARSVVHVQVATITRLNAREDQPGVKSRDFH